MTIRHQSGTLAALAMCFMLSACGGGSTGAGIATTPTPTPAPTPTPTTSTTKAPQWLPSESGRVAAYGFARAGTSSGTTADGEPIFDPNSDDFLSQPYSIRYDADADKLYATSPTDLKEYELVRPDDGAANPQYGTNDPNFSMLMHAGLLGDENVEYVRIGSYGERLVGTNSSVLIAGKFVYGAQTATDQIPISGSATYSAWLGGETELIPGAPDPIMLQGWTYGPPIGDDYFSFFVDGTASFSVDFASGSISGAIDPRLWRSYNCDWDYCENYIIDLPSYSFVNAHLTADRNSFVGQFMVPNLGVDGLLLGGFFGPNATEIGGSFHAPFQYLPDGQWYQMAGYLIGKRD